MTPRALFGAILLGSTTLLAQPASAAAWLRFSLTQALVYGPKTDSSNPFKVSQRLAGDPVMVNPGDSATVRIAGDFRLASGQDCTLPSQPITVGPNPPGQQQWVVGLDCNTVGLVTSPTEPVNALLKNNYPSIAGPVTTQIATGDGVTTVFTPAFALQGTTTAGSPSVAVGSTNGLFSGTFSPNSTAGLPQNGTVAVVDATHFTVTALGASSPTNAASSGQFAFYLGNTGNIPGPNGGSYPFLNATPLPGTISVQAGSLSGTDQGYAGGIETVSGPGITCKVRILESMGAIDKLATEHQGYYRCDLDAPLPQGAPISFTYKYAWVPTGDFKASPSVNNVYLNSLFTLVPSADAAVPRQLAKALQAGVLASSGIPTLDPTVIYGVHPGLVPVPPCKNMAAKCTNSLTDAYKDNSNVLSVEAACPQYSRNNPYSWDGSVALTLSGSGTSAAQMEYCGFDLSTAGGPGQINSTGSYTNVHDNLVRYNVHNTGHANGMLIGGSHSNVSYNEVWLDESALDTWIYDACMFVRPNSGPGNITDIVISHNYMHSCSTDGLDINAASSWTASQNVIVPGGVSLGAHTDGIQTSTVSGYESSNGTIDHNYISLRVIYVPQFWSSLNTGIKTQYRAGNGPVYLTENTSSPTGVVHDIAVTGNYIDGGTSTFVLRLAQSIASSIRIENNISGLSLVFPNNTAFTPVVSGNVRIDSGGVQNPLN